MNISTDNIIFGRNPVREALRANRITKVYLIDNFSNEEILSLIKQQHIQTLTVTRGELDKCCPGVHQGIAAEVIPYSYVSLEYVINKSKNVEKPIIVLLDGINDPHNLGAILRSCDVFGVSGVVVPKHNQVPLTATVGKTSAGAINYIPVALVPNLNQAIATLKKEGFWVIATDGSATQSYLDLKYDFKCAVVIGSEGQGVSSLVLKNSDFIVKIPQYGHVNSLNASVAAGILLAKVRS